eukprot:Em0018g456a
MMQVLQQLLPSLTNMFPKALIARNWAGLYWKMGMTTEISKGVSQMVVLSNDISTMSAGGSMMTKRIKGNARAKGAQRTT